LPRKATKRRNDVKAPTQAKVKYSKGNYRGGENSSTKTKANITPSKRLLPVLILQPRKKRKKSTGSKFRNASENLKQYRKRQAREKTAKHVKYVQNTETLQRKNGALRNPKTAASIVGNISTTKKMRSGSHKTDSAENLRRSTGIYQEKEPA